MKTVHWTEKTKLIVALCKRSSTLLAQIFPFYCTIISQRIGSRNFRITNKEVLFLYRYTVSKTYKIGSHLVNKQPKTFRQSTDNAQENRLYQRTYWPRDRGGAKCWLTAKPNFRYQSWVGI